MVPLNLVLFLVLTFVIPNVINQLVSLVMLNVKLVKTESLLTVSFVLVTESILMPVLAHLVLMKTTLLTVQLVDLNVPLVPMLLILNVVTLVLKEELLIQLLPMLLLVTIVSVHQVLIITLKLLHLQFVILVTMLVITVLLITLVMDVLILIPELITLSVHVLITIMIVEFPSVVNVNPNVTSVNKPQITVSFVLLTESTHQNVIFLHKKSELLELKIFQLVPLLSLCVTVNV